MRAAARKTIPTTGTRPTGAVWLAVATLPWLAPATAVFAQQERAESAAPSTSTEPAALPDVDIPAGLTIEQLFGDFLHFVKLGRFEIANAYGGALLKREDLDPVELLTLADKYEQSVETLINILDHVNLGENAKGILDVIHHGEVIRRKDPERIKANLTKLAGPPQVEFNAIENLRESGEYAIPWMLAALRDREQKALHPRIIRALPQIGKSAVTPLSAALEGRPNDSLIDTIVKTLGKLGYWQAAPYLKALMEDGEAGRVLREGAAEALGRIARQQGRSFDAPASEQFLALAEQYYANSGSVQADPREDIGNVWFWRGDHLASIPVVRRIFDEVMAMRASERTLQLNENEERAIALWMAANFRREAQLGLSVEDEAPPGEDAVADDTRPANFPRSIYFARMFGPHYAHMALRRAIKNNEPAVALGAVAALTVTAGETSLIGTEDVKQPLVSALTFPDLVVRIKAALALGKALPASDFEGSRNVMPVLSEALGLTGQRGFVVVDPDNTTRNALMDALRSLGEGNALAIGDMGLKPALGRAQQELPLIDALFIATDIKDPDLEAGMALIRSDYLFASTPVLLVIKPLQAGLAERIAQKYKGVGRLLVAGSQVPSADAIRGRLDEGAATVGRTPVTPELALSLALDAAETLRMIAVSNSSVYDFNRAEPALVAALKHPSEELRRKAASVLALASSARSQQAIADLAMDDQQSQELRIAVFGSLAESAKHNANKLRDDQVAGLIEQSVREENLIIRTAASKALGALNLPGPKVSKLIEMHPTGG